MVDPSVCTKVVHILLNIVLGVILFVVLLLIVAICIVLFAPLCLWRWFVSNVLKIFRSDLFEIFDPLSQILLASDGEHLHVKRNVTIKLKIAGALPIESLKLRILDNFLNSKDENGNLSYPKLMMHGEYWLGYPFWKSDSNFKLEEHFQVVRIEKNSDEYEACVFNYENELLKISFNHNKSPWQIVYLESSREENSFIIFKCHHSLCDGKAMFNALMNLLADECEPMRDSSKNLSSDFKLLKYLKNLVRLLQMPLEIFKFFKGHLQHTPWNLSPGKASKDSRFIVRSKSHLKCIDLKLACSKYDCSFTSILLAGVSGGIHNFLQKTATDIPTELQTGFPIPRSSHPGNLTNDHSLAILRLPVGETDKLNRLKECEKRLRSLKLSTLPLAQYIGSRLYCKIPHCISSRLSPSPPVALGMSIFPGPSKEATVLGRPVLDVDFKIFVATWACVFLTMCTYNDKIQIGCNADPKIFGSEELTQEFLDEILKEIESLIH